MATNCVFSIDGYVGIGTTIPNYGDKLRIKQSVNTMYAFWLENFCTNQAITLGINDGVARIQTDYAGIGDIPLRIASYTSAYMYFNPGGNVGINTTSPQGLLHVMGTTNQDNYGHLRFENSSNSVGSTTNAQLLGVTKYGCGQYMIWEDKGMRIGMRSIGASAGGAGELYFTTCNDTTQMTIKNNGAVGIGTTTPTSPTGRDFVFAIGSGATGCAAGIVLNHPSNYGGLKTELLNGVVGNGTTSFYIQHSGQYAMTILCNGNMGINCTTPSYKLHVNGTFYAAGSSQDYKEGIYNYNTDSCLFMCLKPKTYQYKDEWCHLGKELKSGTQIGLIAEEVAESHPELAILVNEEDNKVVRNVDYEKLSIVLLAEVQKLRQEVDQLKNK